MPKSNNDDSENSNTPSKAFDTDASEDSKLNEEELSKFSKVNELLKQQSERNNSKSSIRFSLENRSKVKIPIPVYLCEVDGKIVVNIKVNSSGEVIDTESFEITVDTGSLSESSNFSSILNKNLALVSKTPFRLQASEYLSPVQLNYEFPYTTPVAASTEHLIV